VNLYPHQTEALELVKGHNRCAIKGYEGLYEVDTQGNVYSIKRTKSRRIRILKSYPNENGYMKVNLYDEFGKCKKKYVHRLVAGAFIPNPNNLPVIDHIDCDVSNNQVSNLRWCTQSENIKHSWKCGNQKGRWYKSKEVMPNEVI
jgi:hypothetical protein